MAAPGTDTREVSSKTMPGRRARRRRRSSENSKPSSALGIDTYFPTDGNGHGVGIPISAGEFLGIWTQKLAAGGDAPAFTSGAVSAEYVRNSGDTLGTSVAGSAFSGFLVLVQGRIEPDADGDRYGDETQDPCPDTAGLTCPAPVNTVTQTITVPGPTITVPGPTTTVTETVACRTGTKPNAARSACVKITCRKGTKLSGNTCKKIKCRKGTKLRGSTCVKTKAKARAKKSSATSIRTR